MFPLAYTIYAVVYSIYVQPVFKPVESNNFILYCSIIVWNVLVLLHHQFCCWLFQNVKALSRRYQEKVSGSISNSKAFIS